MSDFFETYILTDERGRILKEVDKFHPLNKKS